MNIVQMIMDLLSGSATSKLAGLLGESEDRAKLAAGAAVPAMLSSLSGLASTGGGAQNLANALGKIDPSVLGNLGSVFSGNAGAVADQGGSLLSSLLGNNALSAIIAAIAKFAGIGGDKSKSLLGFLAPLIMGMIAKQFTGKAITPQGLMSLFADQKSNIAAAMPPGFSMPEIPGVSLASHARETAAPATSYKIEPKQEAGMPAWLLPLIGLAAVALLAYLFWPKPAAEVVDDGVVRRDVARPIDNTPPEREATADSVKSDLTSNLSNLITSLTGVTDVATARTALPQIEELATKLSGLTGSISALPEAARGGVVDLVMTNLGALGDQFNRILMLPGVGDVLRPAFESITKTLTSIGGIKPNALTLPSVEVSKLGGDLSGALASLTETLGGIDSAASVDAALPKLKEIDSQLDAAKGSYDALPEAGRSTIASMIQSAMSKLKDLASRVTGLAGVGDTLKPVLDAIMQKLAAFAV